MSEFISINNNEDLVRDSYSKAVLNTNKDALDAWKKRKIKTNQIETHELEINNIRNELDEMKNMLKEIIQRIK